MDTFHEVQYNEMSSPEKIFKYELESTLQNVGVEINSWGKPQIIDYVIFF